jgi:hypothetical protein
MALRKRILAVVAGAAALIVLTASIAMALEQTNGTGTTHNGASIGYNAKIDLTGQITYVTHDGTMWWVQCDTILNYRNLKPDAKGGLRTKVIAECTDKDGNTLWAEIYFTDRGEPGTADRIRAFFTYDSNFISDPNADPDVWLTQCNSGATITEGCMDAGRIQNGNVQIHQDADLNETLVVATV